ncbi:uncharacterized protein LOC131844015 [Achroia grisella]|uniref:uncharacterized protein LOC131844015 n=1 Tax=Achroia grisella TaxID=688607 RepID=UPI0027D22DC2|nr:uncharacterized protein LOC131844015 [Achroia grisella]
MESQSDSAYLNCSNARATLLKLYNLDTPGSLDDAVDRLVEWVQKQEHFTKKDLPREFLEKSLLLAKNGSLEVTKKKIEKLLTVRTLLPYLFGRYNVKKDLYVKNIIHVPLPRLTSDFYRLYLLKMTEGNLTTDDLIKSYRRGVYMTEYGVKHDYFAGLIFIYDFRQANVLDLIAKFSMTNPRLYLTLIEAYGARVKAIHVVMKNATFAEAIMSVMKQILSDKLLKRAQIHKNIESVYNYVPRDLLPVDYGGKEKSLLELNEYWMDTLSTEEHINYVDSMNEAKTDESRRIGDTFNTEHLGMPGTFRSFVVD